VLRTRTVTRGDLPRAPPPRLSPEVGLDDGRRLVEVARDGRFTLVTDGSVLAPDAVSMPGRTTTVRASGTRPMPVRPDGVVAWAAGSRNAGA
jgi:hypothetical protein